MTVRQCSAHAIWMPVTAKHRMDVTSVQMRCGSSCQVTGVDWVKAGADMCLPGPTASHVMSRWTAPLATAALTRVERRGVAASQAVKPSQHS